jgi:hypothetical protein
MDPRPPTSIDNLTEELAQQRAELSALRARMEQPRRRRWGLPRSRVVRTLIVVTLALALPFTVLAAHQFTDVPNSHPFHADIGRVADAGITAGCTANTYCPSANVTREQMAAFLSRTGSRAARATSTATLTANDASRNLTSLTIRAGGVSGGSGFLVVTGSIQAFASAGTCPCTLGARLLVNGSAGGNIHINTTITDTASPLLIVPVRAGNAANTWVFPVSSGANHTVTLQAWWQATTAASGADLRGNLTAIYVPFGSQGGDTLSAADGFLTELEAQQLGD